MNLIINEGIEIIRDAIVQYKGDGYFVEIFLVSLIIMYFMTEKKSFGRQICLYTLVAILVLINPLVAYILKRIALETVYWRTMWILPISLVIAYAYVRIISVCKKSIVQIMLFAICIFSIMFAGKQIITEENFKETENLYKIPNEVVEVADIILKDSDGTAKVIATDHINVWIREYSAEIELMYGRGHLFGYEAWNEQNDFLKYLFNREKLDIDALDRAIRKWNYEYLVLEKNRIDIELIKKYGYELLGETNNYNIFAVKYY